MTKRTCRHCCLDKFQHNSRKLWQKMDTKKSKLHFKKSLLCGFSSIHPLPHAHAHVYKQKGAHLRHWETCGVFSRDLSVWSKPVTHTVHVLRLSTSDNSPVRSHMFTLSAIVAPILQRQHNNFRKRKANIHSRANVPPNVCEGDGLQWACWFLCVVAHLVGTEWDSSLLPLCLLVLLLWSHP